jgi:hypothetical protein
MSRLRLTLPLLFILALVATQWGSQDSTRAASALPSAALKPVSLCAQNERAVWSCETVKERKLVSICSSQVLDKMRGYVQYRFGRVGQVEMEFPRERVNTQAAFTYSRYTRPLVTYLKLEFVNNGFTYTISDDSNGEEKPARRDAYITVKPAGAAGARTQLRCRKPLVGSLMTLEDVVRSEDYMP